MVLEGPDLERNKVAERWRCADLQAEIASRWSGQRGRAHGRQAGAALRLRMTRLQPRPYHPKKDPAAPGDF